MDVLSISGEHGHYKLVLKEIEIKGIAYIIINDCDSLALILEEAIKVLNNYKPKEIYYKYSNYLGSPYVTIDKYQLKHKHFPPNKNIKFKPLDLENRYAFAKMATESMFNVANAASYNDADVFNLMKEYGNNIGYFYYKHEYIGGYLLAKNEIELFFIAKKFQHQGLGKQALIKLINKIDDDVYLDVASNNTIALELYKGLGFEYCSNVSKWYKWEEEK